MTLKARIAIGYTVILASLVLAMVVLARNQREDLVSQVDMQLLAAAPLVASSPFQGPPPVQIDRAPPQPSVSDLYIAQVTEKGDVRPFVVGELLDDTPAITPTDLRAAGDRGLITVNGTSSSTRFRAIVVNRPDGGWGVAAVPLTATERTINKLLITLGTVTLIIAAALGLSAIWVIRLGIRPIGRVTDAADRIAAGDTAHRVAVSGPATEAGRLARAFNVMLDDRDEDEARLRQFIADASHELRTPLTSIRGYLDIYADGGFPNQAILDEAMRRMRKEALRMNDLVDELLLLASLDQGRPLDPTDVDVIEVLRDAATDAQAMDADHPIEVLHTSSEHLVLPADDMRLRQVIASLVHNAIVHTPSGTRIMLRADRRASHVDISIADEGPGLEPEFAQHVFDRFVRGDPARARQGGGSGLGLSIASSLIHAHGGRIFLRTTPGEGCCFHIELPTGTGPTSLRAPAQGGVVEFTAPERSAPRSS